MELCHSHQLAINSFDMDILIFAFFPSKRWQQLRAYKAGCSQLLGAEKTVFMVHLHQYRQYGKIVRILSTFRQFHQRPQEKTGRREHIVIIFGFLMSPYVCKSEKWVEILNLHTFSQDTTAQFFIQMKGSLAFLQNVFS